jgi:uncharacterized protein
MRRSTVLAGNPVKYDAAARQRVVWPRIGAAETQAETLMELPQILEALKEFMPLLAKEYGVKHLALFGSTVRGTARPDSDIDVLVSFDGPATSSRYFGVQFFLEDQLGRSVDLVTDKALRTELKPFVEAEAISIS